MVLSHVPLPGWAMVPFFAPAVGLEPTEDFTPDGLTVRAASNYGLHRNLFAHREGLEPPIAPLTAASFTF